MMQTTSASCLLASENHDIDHGVAQLGEPLTAPCKICLHDRPLERAYQCPHCDAHFCYDCFHLYLTNKIENGDIAPHQLVCPGDCRQPVPRHVLARVVSASHLQKYVRFLEAYELRQRGHRYCPRPQCGQLLPTSTSHKTKPKRRIDCPSCLQSSCRDCGGDYHRWSRCDHAYTVWCEKNGAQRCPWCSTMIEKVDGCSSMECAYCRFEFCWRCRVDLDDHNTALCSLRAIARSEHRYFGPVAPVRFVTKTVAGVVTAGATIVVIAVAAPPLAILYAGCQICYGHGIPIFGT
ncbi:hypothetical protein SPRG_13645 [Saprolegnia parasitica CBS 223.65]|uniref:RBR-type E3 ubiquitin transferase n=1 Tax=Saprolegnia parasitica (strain CBS 223.65) TaxID=695850 RepID=A0A067BVG5_SAPPC|nr:hypothetical protein SPRG_13645 [Saprolegnia parasitica CBS 223.65]KDO20830.1 hypothetical protein SPRG_13645 [Saprolegnia parasitica CBS 223.65]|eukprot:XP_012208488.1 hypothetical protein SPRG_13645 [Saprolegnia parasitica CBS 223.65]